MLLFRCYVCELYLVFKLNLPPPFSLPKTSLGREHSRQGTALTCLKGSLNLNSPCLEAMRPHKLKQRAIGQQPGVDYPLTGHRCLLLPKVSGKFPAGDIGKNSLRRARCRERNINRDEVDVHSFV